MPQNPHNTVHVSITPTPEMKKRLVMRSKENGRSLNGEIIYILNGVLHQESEADANANRLGKERMRVA